MTTRRVNRRTLAVAAVVATAMLLGGCSSQTADSRGSQSGRDGGLTIFAAASLTASFDALAQKFSADNSRVVVKPIVYDGSATLATQLKEGARADVFASADQQTMAELEEKGLIAGRPEVFATNTLQIAVQPGNPKHIVGLADLARPDLTVVLCAPEVPCGAAAQRLLAAVGGGVHVTPASEEQNVKAVLTKVSGGEADAGLVYTTDVQASLGAVDGVSIDHASRAANRYAIAVPAAATNPAAAQAFIDWVRSPGGQAILRRFGFGAP
jgi:molybdate transport system substrate-binding protein